MNRPCLGCGVLVASGSRCTDCQRPLNNNYVRGKKGRTASDWQHRKQSTAQRKRVPFCELRTAPNCTGKPEVLDHILPISQYPEHVSAPENHRSACRPCNSARGNRCTDDERSRVLDAIARRRNKRCNPN